MSERKHMLRKKVTAWLAALLLLFIAFAFLAPTILTISGSFFTQAELSSNFKQYATVLFLSPEYLFKFWNSVKYTVPIMAFQTIVACLAAYGLTRYRSKGRELILFIYIILMLMPYQVTLVPNRLVAEWLHIYGTSWAVILPGIFSPFAVFLLTKAMRRVPMAVIEAARLDGCSEWQIFFKIYLPLCKNIIYSVMILVFIDYWNMVEQPLILLGSEHEDLYSSPKSTAERSALPLPWRLFI